MPKRFPTTRKPDTSGEPKLFPRPGRICPQCHGKMSQYNTNDSGLCNVCDDKLRGVKR